MVAVRQNGAPEEIKDQENAVAGLNHYDPSIDRDPTDGGRPVNPAAGQALLRQHLGDKEASGGPTTTSGQANPEDAPIQISGTSASTKKGQKQPSLRSKLASRFKRTSKAKKFIIGGGILGAFGLLGLLVVLLIIASLLKIPNLAANISEYEFARLLRQVGDSEIRTSQQALEVDSVAADSVNGTGNSLNTLTDDYPDEKSLIDSLNSIRPSQIIANLRNQSGVKVDDYIIGLDDVKQNPFLAPSLGATALRGVELNGQTFSVDSVALTPADFRDLPTLLSKLSGFAKFQRDVNFAREFAPALRESIGADDLGSIIRANLVANDIRTKLGISLRAWGLAEFLGKNPQQATDQINRDAYNEISQGETPADGATGVLNQAEDKAVNDTTQMVNSADAQVLEDTIRTGINKQVVNDVTDTVNESALQQFVGFANPVYGVALPACIIYEGSLDSAGPMINNNTTDQQRAFYFLASAADQQDQGVPNGGNWQAQLSAIQAMNSKVGDITQSNPYIRANGGTVDTSSTALSSEAGATQQFTLIDATPGIGGTAVGNIIKTIAGGNPNSTPPWPGTCPILSNFWFGVTGALLIQLAAIVPDIVSGGTVPAAEAGADAATTGIVDRIVSVLTQKILLANLRAVITEAPGDIVKLTALTILAKLIVMNRAMQFNNGLEQGADFANEADSGANINAGEYSRRLGGRPLTCSETDQSNTADRLFIADQNQQRSVADRYLAMSNPDSLLSHMAMMAVSQFNGAAILQPSESLLNIFTGPISFGSIFGSLTGRSYAATPCDAQYYGNVQFGWSEAEENLIDSNSSYMPLENQHILNQSGKADAIAQQYAPCFGYSYASGNSGSLDPTDPNSKLQIDTTGPGSIGSLLSSGDILRTTDGDLASGNYLCSPQNLGVNNPQYGDLVFRWRLTLSYDTTISQLTNLQTIGN